MGDEPFGRTFGPDLFARFSECQGFGLGENVGNQNVVMAAERIQGLAKARKSHGIRRVPWWIIW